MTNKKQRGVLEAECIKTFQTADQNKDGMLDRDEWENFANLTMLNLMFRGCPDVGKNKLQALDLDVIFQAYPLFVEFSEAQEVTLEGIGNILKILNSPSYSQKQFSQESVWRLL